MGRPEEKEKFQIRRKNFFKKELQKTIFHEKKQIFREKEKKISINNYKEFIDDDGNPS